MLSESRRTVSPLAIVLPHPQLPRRRSSLLSSSSSPRTPRSCSSPSCSSFYLNSSKRKSTDSWNSSNYDVGEDDAEWKQDQILLLQRTLNALPAHLVTPFNGPIPPSNLLDKIARGIADRKGPNDWTHSLRATRAKIVELCRTRAAEDALFDQQRRIVTDENDDILSYNPDTDNSNSGHGRSNKATRPPIGRRLIYRQSSMDFLNDTDLNVKNNDRIGRLSLRLQRNERTLHDPSFHPYSRSRPHRTPHNRTSSPPRLTDLPPLVSPSSPSSSTLNTISSLSAAAPGSRSRFLRRSSSYMSTTTSGSSLSGGNRISADLDSIADDNHIYPSSSSPPPTLLPSSMRNIPDPRVQRVRRSESFCAGVATTSSSQSKRGVTATSSGDIVMTGSVTPPSSATKVASLKRAPSFGTVAQEAKVRRSKQKQQSAKAAGDVTTNVPPVLSPSPEPSSDEEEKMRSRSAKKQRTKNGTTTASSQAARATKADSQPPPLPSKSSIGSLRRVAGERSSGRVTRPRTSTAAAAATMFGEDLPVLHIPSHDSQQQRQAQQDQTTPPISSQYLDRPLPDPPVSVVENATRNQSAATAAAPAPVKSRTLRRVRHLPTPAVLSRRISFGSLKPLPPVSGEDADAEEEDSPSTSSTATSQLGSAFQLR